MLSRWTTDQINYLNVVLMVLSVFLAFLFPFELFLFSYAILGPLHYLTEISWLHDKNYYTLGKRDSWFLLVLGIAVTLLFFGAIPSAPRGSVEFLTCLAFSSALFFILTKKIFIRLIGLGLIVLLSLLFIQVPLFASVFGIFLPTLIHVFVFTGIFLLGGTLKGRSFSGLVSLGVFIAIPLGLVLFHPAYANYHVSNYAHASYGHLEADGKFTGFISLNYNFFKLFNLHSFTQPGLTFPEYIQGVNSFLYENSSALALMTFIAFAYTYHFLNWFSKTSIIRWHEVPHNRFVGVFLIWGISLALYAYNYSLGFQWLFFLSLIHVFLEFPLDHLTILNIFKVLPKSFLDSGKQSFTREK